ncbi:Uncharacterized protein HZ326_12810 [Fusarium oxysporum f. sp. albedinis]|nr:Uncharacterized protein HZ326_12810 [Fusarium oxysporum f. sp. albedinis]
MEHIRGSYDVCEPNIIFSSSLFLTIERRTMDGVSSPLHRCHPRHLDRFHSHCEALRGRNFFHVCCVVTCIREVYVMARCIASMGPPGKGCRCSLEFDAGSCWVFANNTQGKTMKGFHRQLSSCLSLSHRFK